MAGKVKLDKAVELLNNRTPDGGFRVKPLFFV